MRRGIGEETVIENDVDDTADQTPGELDTIPGELVSGEVDDVVPLPVDSGKSLVALIAAWLGGILLSFFVAKGWMTTEQSAEFAPAITVAVVGGVSYVTARFLKSRSDVKVEALKAHAVIRAASATRPLMAAGRLEPATLGVGPMGGFAGFSLKGLLGMLATANTMVSFMPLDANTKKTVQKSINAAIAAIKSYSESA